MGYDFKKIKNKIKGAANTNKNPKELAKEALFVGFWLFAVIFITIAILDLWLNLTPCFRLFTGDLDSARYLLSALAQVQAAIIALVVTLTLVAVQLASQSYSPRVMDLFGSFRNYPFWLLLLLYFVSIMYDVMVLGTLDSKKLNELPVNRISFAVFLTGFAIAALVPYTRNVINNLKPENVIKQIIGKINRKDIKEFVENINKTVEEKKKENISYTYHPRDLEGGKHKIIPVVDIIKRAIKEDDITTSREGIREIGKIFEYVFSLKELINRNEENLVRHFGYHLETIGDRAVFREDGDSVIEVCSALGKIGKSTAEKELDYAAGMAANSLGKIGAAAAEKGLDYAAVMAADSLGRVGAATAEKGLNGAAGISVESLGKVGVAAAEKGLDNAAGISADYLGKVGAAAAEKGLDNAAQRAADSLEKIGVAAAGKGLDNAAQRAADSLGKVGVAAAEIRLTGGTWWAAVHLCKLGVVFIRHEIDINGLINDMIKMHEKSSMQVEGGIANCKFILEKEGDESKLNAFQEFKTQLTFLK